jgi:hypothetical protein
VQQASLTGGGDFATIAYTSSFFQSVTVTAGTSLAVASGSTLTLQLGLTNDGIVDVGDAGGAATLELFGAVKLAGAGEVHLHGSTIDSAGATSSLTNDSTVIGSGQIGGDGMKLINSAVITAAGGDLVVDTATSTIINRGAMTGGDGSTLSIVSALQNYGQLSTAGTNGVLALAAVINSGGIDNALTGTISASSALTNQAAGTITNHGEYDQHSTVANFGQIDNVEGDFTVDSDFTNIGSIQVDGGQFEIDGITTNRGTITTGAGGDVVHGSDLVNSVGGTVTAAGTYSVNGNLTNRSLIDSTGGMFTVSGNISNFGSISVESGSSFTADGRLSNNTSGSLSVDDGTMFVQSTASGGSAALLNGGTLEFGGRSTVDVSFDDNANLLLLDHSPQYVGDLETFVSGNTVAFMDMASSDSINFNYTANTGGTGGVLKVIDSTAHLTAAIHIVGMDYTTTDFLASSYVSPTDPTSHFAVVSQHPV